MASKAVVGLVSIPSRHSVRQTIDRLAAGLAAAGIAVFARIDHSAGAMSAGLDLRPTELLIFGNPKTGTPLMQADQAIGLDLPLKALAWEDAHGNVWLNYNDPIWLAERYNLETGVHGAVSALAGALEMLTAAAAAG